MNENEQHIVKDNSSSIKLALMFRKAERIVKGRENRFLRDYNLTSMQYCVMEVLHHRGSMSVQQLIDAVYATPGNMTVVIHNMERDGYIRREKNPKDRRSYKITLSEAGEELITRVIIGHVKMIGETMSIFSEEEKAEIIESLNKFEKENPEFFG